MFGFEHDMPLAGAFAATADAAVQLERYPLTWRYCLDCLLVQVEQDVPDDTLYTHYNYASSTIPALCEHFDEFAAMLRSVYSGRDEPYVVEIGCNDGVLLNRLPDEWILAGYDPSDIARNAAPEDAHYLLIDAPFPSHVIEDADVIIASNVLAHMSDIRGTLEAAYKALRLGGDLWIEVHDLDETLRRGQWDTIYHEHKVEWSERSLYKACTRLGFNRIFAERRPLHGGLLRQCFRKETRHDAPWRATGTPDDFTTLGLRYRERRDSPLYDELWREFSKIAYGAAGRASVWFNQLPELTFQAVIDDSPQRIGKYVPGVGYPIVRWGERPESKLCLVTAWNYAERIEAAHPEYDGRWLRTFG